MPVSHAATQIMKPFYKVYARLENMAWPFAAVITHAATEAGSIYRAFDVAIAF